MSKKTVARSKLSRPRKEKTLAATMLRRLREGHDLRTRKARRLRARANPGAEAARIGVDLNEGLPAGTITTDPKQPLAINMNITDGARMQAAWLIANSVFGHSGPGGNSPFDRMLAAGWQTSGDTIW